MNEEKYFCPHCGHQFEQGESNYNYDTALLDFECNECGWEGNETQLEREDEDEDCEYNIQIWDGCYDQRKLKRAGYGIMVWPDSQELMEMQGRCEHTWLINDERGLDRFGSSAYVYDIDWYNANQK